MNFDCLNPVEEKCSGRSGAYYRHHRDRIIKKKVNILENFWKHEKLDKRERGKLSKGKIHCGCWMCACKVSLCGWKISDLKIIENMNLQLEEHEREF